MSFVFQSFNLFPGLTAAENVQFGADVAGRADPGRVAAEVLDEVGLGARLGHFRTSSRAGSSSARRSRGRWPPATPSCWPTSPPASWTSAPACRSSGAPTRQADAGKTVLVVTHNREISRAADRAVELSSGRIVHDGAPRGGCPPPSCGGDAVRAGR